MNHLYFGDNLDVLKQLHRQHPEGFIDLIYIDPPFNSKRNYNVLFESLDMADTKAQKEAFADTWSNVSYLDTLNELRTLNPDVYTFIETLDRIRISKSAVAYLTTMAIRIYYMHRLLKDTGSFYLHCDPTMSHYLKLLCDLIFGYKNFNNEISWKRANPKSLNTNNFVNSRDIIFRYTKTNKNTFNKIYSEHDTSYLISAYKYVDNDGRKYTTMPLLNPNDDRPNLTYEFLGHTKVWRWTKERMQKAYEDGLIVQSKPGAVPRYKKFLDESEGKPITNDWNDVQPVSKKDELGYPTQKPLALMERIIQASSNESDLVADFFCGCGTTIAAAQKLNRRWLGSDISHLAVKLISKRLSDAYGPEIRNTYEIFGFPKDLDSARELAINPDKGRFKFEEWVVEVMMDGVLNATRTQTGFDGYLTFDFQGKKELVMIEVKSGGATLTQLNHFIQTVTEKKGDVGVFVCFAAEVTGGMTQSAKRQGYYREDMFGTTYDKIQLLTVEDLINHKAVNIPRSMKTTFKTAKRETGESKGQERLF
jgi:site-specific DNA-methyltransferase (adenine-specific)